MILRNIDVNGTRYINEYIQEDHPAFRAYKRFNRESSCVVSLYEDCLPPKVVTPGTAKVIIAPVDEGNGPPDGDMGIDDMGEVLAKPWPFDFAAYWKQDEQGKKRMTLEVLQEGILWLAKRKRWPIKPFKAAYREVLARDLKNEAFWAPKPHWTSPNRQYKARIFCAHDFHSIQVFAVLYDKSLSELARAKLLELKPYKNYILWHTLGSCKWTTNDCFALISRDKKEKWKISVSRLLKQRKSKQSGRPARL